MKNFNLKKCFVIAVMAIFVVSGYGENMVYSLETGTQTKAYIQLEVNYMDGEGKQIRKPLVKRIRVGKDNVITIKQSIGSWSQYKYKGSKYSIDGSYMKNMDSPDGKYLRFDVNKNVKKVTINQYYDRYVNVSLSTITPGKLRAGEQTVSTVSVRNSSRVPVYSAFVVFEVAGRKYEKQVDLPEGKSVKLPFTWKVPLSPGNINIRAEVVLGGEYKGFNKGEGKTVKYINAKID